jgi:hypothetical protein
MGVMEDISDLLSPHASRLNQTIASTGVFLHSKLDAIEQAIRESSGAGDWNNLWYQVKLPPVFAVTTYSGGGIQGGSVFAPPLEVPRNEIWIIEALSTGEVDKPFLLFTSDGKPILFVEAKGQIFVAGHIVLLPGEELLVGGTEAECKKVASTLHIIRRKMPSRPRQKHDVSGELVQSRNVHEPERDIITSKTGTYIEDPQETVSVDPTEV